MNVYIHITLSGWFRKLLGVLVPLSEWWLKPSRILQRLTVSSTLCLQNLRSVSSVSSLKILCDAYLHLISCSTINSKQHRMKSGVITAKITITVRDGSGWSGMMTNNEDKKLWGSGTKASKRHTALPHYDWMPWSRHEIRALCHWPTRVREPRSQIIGQQEWGSQGHKYLYYVYNEVSYVTLKSEIIIISLQHHAVP